MKSTGKIGAKKIGRWGRSPANVRYKAEGRRDLNKARKAQLQAKQEERAHERAERRRLQDRKPTEAQIDTILRVTQAGNINQVNQEGVNA